ncbi:hypothetical protein [Mesorhizobium sp.]|uniref:hypothetical protein n=1 Tax=Mesorhizobium sp. TaxID=1871066 RepID=UPI0025DE2AE7|nr:hypothetical protein [Mesorhizobium sp.]
MTAVIVTATVITTTVVIGERRFWSELSERQLAARRLKIDHQRDGYPERQQSFWSQP